MSPEQWEYINDVQDYLRQYGLIWATALTAGGIASYFCWPKKPVKVPGEGSMKRAEYILSKREQKQQENNVIADEVEDFLLKLLTAGKITEDRYRYWHARFGTQLNLKGLLPGKLTAADVKKAAKARLANGVYKPVPFPREEKIKKPKNIIDRILHSTST